MGYFPFFMDIAGKNGVIVGGGKVAARKVEKLLAFGPKLTVIASRIEDGIRMMREATVETGAASLILKEQAFQMSDLTGADFVIAATDDEALNSRISEYCIAERIPVNVVDDREKCSFLFPALVQEGDLTIGISTNGKSPTAAAWVRRELSQTLPEGLGETIDLMSQIRLRVMELTASESKRREIFEKLFSYCMGKKGDVPFAELLRCLEGMLDMRDNGGCYEEDSDRDAGQ